MRLSSHYTLLPLILATLGSLAQAARILAVMSIPSTSHHLFVTSVLRVLAKAGHEVVFYTPFFMEHPVIENYTEIVIDSQQPTEATGMNMYKTLQETNIKDKCWDTYFGLEWFQQLTSSKQIKRLISSNETFDLVITEAFMMQEFNLMFAHIFKAPSIVLSALSTTSMVNNDIGNTLSISTLPNLCAIRQHNMGFFDRLLNAYYILRRHNIHYNQHLPEVERRMSRFFSDIPPLSELIQNVSLVFVNDHSTASYAQPRTSNLIPIAGINLRPSKPLPQDIQTFMDDAPDGVIFFSLGTMVPEHLSPKEYFDMFKDVFRPLKQRVLWKTKLVLEDVPPNVMTAAWFPQSDILAHKNCVLFITHGGLNSQIETIHHGVPVVVIPYVADQPSTAMLYVAKGVGVLLEPPELSRETLSTAISTVLQNASYSRRMKSLSSVFRDRPMSPEQTVVYWTEYVLRHRGAPHLRPPPQSFYQRALLDVGAAVLVAIVISFVVLYWVVKPIITDHLKHVLNQVARLKKHKKVN